MSIRLRRSPLRRAFLVAALSVAALVGIGPARRAAACPFCSAVSLTFAQEIAQSQAAVIARLVEPPAPGSLGPRAEGPLPKGKFAVVEVLKGGDLVAEAGRGGADGPPIETILLEEKPVGTLFLLMAVEPPKLVWSSPIPVSPRAVEYIRALGGLPEKGPDRLAFFQRHLEDADETLARDAYDEFAVAPYADVRGLADRMDSGRLLEWIENPKVQANRRRLYATMLGTCGTPRDADRIAQILANENLGPDKAESRNGLDALIACYVTLRGPEGLDLVDKLFLTAKAARFPSRRPTRPSWRSASLARSRTRCRGSGCSPRCGSCSRSRSSPTWSSPISPAGRTGRSSTDSSNSSSRRRPTTSSSASRS
jgi:hypothetical protein